MPAISLIMPTFNRAPFIAAAIGSILRQTERDFELIVWDDGSTDDTGEVARHAAGDDPRVRVMRSETNGGISVSINAAARFITGNYMGWVDSDDGLAPTALSETRAVLDANPNVGMVYTDYLVMDESGRVTGQGTRTKIPYSKDRLLIDFMTFHFRLMRRELFHQAGALDEQMDAAQDYDLCLRLSEITEIQHLARPLYLYRVHKNTISSANRLRQIMKAKEAIEKALRRRKMDGDYELDLELVGRFRLKKKSQDTP